MAATEGGEEFSLDVDTWEMMDIQSGDILEVHMPSTDWVDPPDVWAGFLVRQVSVEVGTQALVVTAKSLGSENADLAKAFANLFNRREGTLHLCGSRPCATTNTYEMHVTRLRVYKEVEFNPSYLTRSMRSQMRKWLEKESGEERARKKVGTTIEAERKIPRERRWRSSFGTSLPGQVQGQPHGGARKRKEERTWRRASSGSSVRSKGEVGFVESSLEWFGEIRSEGYRGRSRGWHLRSGVFGGRWRRLTTGRVDDGDGDNPFSRIEEQEEEDESEEESCAMGGFKRRHYARLTRAAGQQGRGCQWRQARQEEKQKEHCRESRRGHCKSSGLRDGQEGKERQEEEEKRQREETTAKRRRRRSRELRWERQFGRKLRRILGQDGKQQQRGVRESNEEEEQRSSWSGSRTSCSTCPRTAGTIIHGVDSPGKDQDRRRCETPFLLSNPTSTSAGSSDRPSARDVLDSVRPGPTSQRKPERRRGRTGGSVFRVASEHLRRWMERRSTLGDLLDGGDICYDDGYASPDPSACEAGGKGLGFGAGPKLVERCRPWSWWKGCKGTQRRRDRDEREERRKISKGQRPRRLVWREELGQCRRKRRERSPRLGKFKRTRERLMKKVASDPQLADGRVEGIIAGFLKDGKSRWCDFGRAIEFSNCLARMGCILSWMMVQCFYGNGEEQVSRQVLQAMLKGSAAKSRALPSRRKGEALPLRIGELWFLKDELRRLSLAEVAAESFVEKNHLEAWLLLAIAGLNRLHGSSAVLMDGPWTKLEKVAAENLRAAIARRCQNDPSMEMTYEEVGKDILSKRVGYGGEEVHVCHQLSLEQVEPSLPPLGHGGIIDALDWVGESSRQFLLNPHDCLIDVPDLGKARIPGKVHVCQGEKIKLACELVKRGVCVWHPLDDVHRVRGTPLLNGMFGVPKAATVASGAPVLRLIMNLIPSNCCLQQLQGKVSSLPNINVWQSVYLDGEQELRLFQSDMSSAFYLFSLPACWYRYLAFNIVVDGKDIKMANAGKWALCCAVIPMGWASSVGLMQEISENLLLRGGLNPRRQVRRGSTLPEWMVKVLHSSRDGGNYWWHVYLDNFCAAEKVRPPETEAGGRECHILAEKLWNSAKVLSSEKKRKSAEARIEELGAEVDGDQGMLGGSSERLRKICLATMWLLNQRYLKRKQVQIVAGRWVFAMQFRRPTMSIFNAVWAFVGNVKSCRVDEVRQELATAITLCPLMHSSLRAPLSEIITASDASSTGGAVSVSHELTDEGKDFTGSSQVADSEARPAPIAVISLFNGIGGTFRRYDICGIRPMVRIAFDTCKESNRVTQKRWPDVLIYLDVRDLGPSLAREWRLRFGDIEEIHLWGGFPCVDLSSAKAFRRNLDGPGSSLFWEIPRILGVLKAEFKSAVKIKSCFENVASMDSSAAQEISEALGTKPYRVDCWQAVPMHRPRFAWISEKVEGMMPGLEFTPQAFWTDIVAKAEYPAVEQWLQAGRIWDGGQSHAVFPTCMKSIPRTSPPPKPAGIDRCDGETIARWVSDEYRFPPYQYKDQFLITSASSWRLLSPVERELLLGYGFRHTAVCMSASDIKSNKRKYEDVRLSLLGDSFSVFSFVIFAYALSIKFTTRAPYQHWCNRMGMAPGYLSPARLVAPIARKLCYGTPKGVRGSFGVRALNQILLKRTDHTGSDVRLVSGEQLVSKIFPRQAVCAQWWTWEPGFQLRWKQKAHINLLELEAILLACKFQVSRYGASQSRIFHISDSYVCISIVSKGRSGSMVLQRKLRQLAAFLLAFGLQLIIAHVESTDNPTDAASRA